MYDVIIIGAGPAGLSAAVYCCRSGLSCLVLESTMYGGQIMTTPEVENYPGMGLIPGFQLAENLYNHAVAAGAEVTYATVSGIIDDGELKTVLTDDNAFIAKSVIIANGAKRRNIGCPGEDRFAGSGVSYCAYCDGSFFKGKSVAVVGGGNSAVEDAVYLSNICNDVYIIHRKNEYRAQRHLIDSLNNKDNIHQVLSSVVQSIDGTNSVESVTVHNVETDKVDIIPVDGVFVSVGLIPDNAAFEGVVQLDSVGYIVSGEDCKTSAPGIFVAGDTRTKALRQIVTACSDGAVAATSALDYINTL